MLSSIHHYVFNFTGIHTWVDAAAFVTFVLALGAIGRHYTPKLRARRLVEKRRNLTIDGGWLPGMSEVTKPLEQRLQSIESTMATKDDVATIRTVQTQLVNAVNALSAQIEKLDVKVSPNGGTKPDIGDTSARTETMVRQVARKVGVTDLPPPIDRSHQ
jgi:hypothetical protein